LIVVATGILITRWQRTRPSVRGGDLLLD